MLTKFAEGRSSGFLFATKRSTPLVQSYVREYVLTPCGVPGMHSLRRYRATWLEEQCCPRSIQAFSDGDSVSIHTLTAAAYNVLRDITKQKGIDPMLIKGQMLELVRPEHKKMIMDKTNEAENFFKHADRDHEATIKFNPDTTALYLIDACAQYRKLTGEEPLLFLAYRIWVTANYPDIFIFDDEFKKALKATVPSIVQMGRAVFLRAMLPLLMNIGKQPHTA